MQDTKAIICIKGRFAWKFKVIWKEMMNPLYSPYHDIEIKLYSQLMLERRKASRKCSAKWIHITALKILEQLKDKILERWNDSIFKSSYGCMRIFMTRRRIKFWKQKCSKEGTVKEF
jgi:hypothetical protein